MSGCFVHEFWGSPNLVPNFTEMREEVAWALRRPLSPQPVRVYVYGRDNFDFVRSLGESPILMDERPFMTEGKSKDADGALIDDVSIWRHKYLAIRDALTHYPHVIHLDFDTVLTKPLPADFWDRMADGPVFKAPLQQNFRKHAGQRMTCTWPGKQHETDDARKTPIGAFLYFRGFDPIDRMLRLYDEYPRDWDLAVLSRLVDELMDGWKGWQAYKELGFEPDCCSLGSRGGRHTFRPEPGKVLFEVQWRKIGFRKLAIKARGR